uniref:Uncharacterized protein n=1 Tax=Romanomermis culicivorax TaxID=13658 RepID=A0A915K458_ROMCU
MSMEKKFQDNKKKRHEDPLLSEARHGPCGKCGDDRSLVTRVRFAHDEQKRVALASMDGTITILKISSTPDVVENVLKLKGHKMGVIGSRSSIFKDIVWSISNDFLLSCSMDSTLRLWDPNDGKCKRIIDDNSPVLCCLFQPINNNLVVTGNLKGLVQVMNISTGKYLKFFVPMANSFWPDRFWGSPPYGNDFWVLLMTVCRQLHLKSPYPKPMIATGLTNTRSASPYGRQCLGSYDTFTFPNCKLLHGTGTCKMSGAAVCMCCDNNGRSLWVGDDKGTILSFLVDATLGKLVKGRRSSSLLEIVSASHLLSNSNTETKCSPHLSGGAPEKFLDFHFLKLSGGEDGFVHLFDLSKSDRSNDKKLNGHTCPVIDVCFNHDESFLVSGDSKDFDASDLSPPLPSFIFVDFCS